MADQVNTPYGILSGVSGTTVEPGFSGIAKLAPGLSVADSAALGGRPASAYATVESEPFRIVGAPGEPPFQNGWENNNVAGNAPVAFYKDPIGVVHLQGDAENTATGQSTVFTLPPGYRPSAQLLFSFSDDTVLVHDDGSVRANCSGGCFPTFTGITFRAGQ